MNNISISKEQINLMLHSLGINHTRNGECLQPNRRYSPYPTSNRNYFQTSNCKDWDILVQREYAKFRKGIESWQDCYHVTESGKNHLEYLGYKWHDKTKR